MKKILSLKVGLNHVGFALVEKSPNDELNIIKTGAHFFKAAENPKTKATLNQAWAKNRQDTLKNRRKIKRRDGLLNILNRSFLQSALSTFKPEKDVWMLRKEALTRKLTENELLHVILHLNKNRGYKAFTKKINDERDDVINGRILEAIAENEKNMRVMHSKTYGEYIYNRATALNSNSEFTNQYSKRNKNGDYTLIAKREWIENELTVILKTQKKFYGDEFFSDTLQEELIRKVTYQRPLKSCKELIGNCNLFPNEKNTPKSHPLVLEFQLLTLLNSATFYNLETSENYIFTETQLQTLVKKLYDTGKIGVRDVKSVLELAKDTKLENYKKLTSTFFTAPTLLPLKEMLGIFWDFFFNIEPDLLEEILIAVSYFFSEDQVKNELIKNVFTPSNIAMMKLDVATATGKVDINLDDEINSCIEKLAASDIFRGTTSISLKAVKILLPLVRKGMSFNDAVEHAKFHKSIPMDTQGYNLKKLPPFVPTFNAVVNRSLAQTRKIINNIILHYGEIDELSIESGIELGKSVLQRKKIRKTNAQHTKEKIEVKELITELDMKDTQESLLLMRVWKQQNCTDFLTGEVITTQDIKSGRCCLVPINEKSLNRNFSNMIVVFKDSLREKYKLIENIVESIEEKKEDYYFVRLSSMKKYLANDDSFKLSLGGEKSQQDWVLKALREHLYKYMCNVKINTCPRGVLPFLRHQWNVDYDNQTAFDRVAMEALLVGSVTRSMINKINQFLLLPEDEASDFKVSFPYDAINFENSLLSVQPTVMPVRTHDGEGHEYKTFKTLDPTIKTMPAGSRVVFPKKLEREEGSVETKLLKRISLTEITESNFKLIYNFKHNPDLEVTLKNRLDEFKWNAEKAFVEPVYIQNKRDKNKKVLIKKLYIYDDSRCGIALRHGFSNYSTMVCINIYKKDHRFLGSPIYSADIIKLKHDTARARKNNAPLPVFPTTVIGGSGEVPLEGNEKFVGRVYYGDYLKLIRKCVIPGTDKPGTEIIEGYYNTYNRSTNAIFLMNWCESIYDEEDKLISSTPISEITKPFSITKVFDIQFFHVDMLGNLTPKTIKEIPLVR